ncbi:hypothetical protein FQ087_20490 [Sporosarcina sp. ANT_H38]|nr:hypothetical protein FQ087_20490 [Sporosarcina sp. ANT_H38]
MMHCFCSIKRRLCWLLLGVYFINTVCKEVIDDYTEQLQISTDLGLRVGHKTEESFFFGYNTYIAMYD